MKYKIKDIKNKILCGDVISELKKIPKESIDTVITSPSYYGLRDYSALYDKQFPSKKEAQEWINKQDNKDYFSKIRELQDINSKIVGYKAIIYSKFIKKNQVGLEESPQDYIDRMVKVAHEIKRVLNKTGSFWINIADSYWTKSGSGTIYGNLPNQQEDEYGVSEHRHTKRGTGKYPSKCLCMIPERLAIAMIDDGWILRNKIIWSKQVLIDKENKTIGNCMPCSTIDRHNTCWEYFYFFVKSRKYYFNIDSIRIPHQTQLLERYQEAVNLGAIQVQGKIFEDKRIDKPMQPPKVFREKFGKDKNYQGKFDGYGIESESYGSPRARNERTPRSGLVPGNTSQARPEHDVRDLRKGRGGNNSELGNRNFMPIKKVDETTMFFQEQKKQGGNTNLPWKPHRAKTQDEYYKIGMRNAPEPGEPSAFNVRGKNIPDCWNVNTSPSSIKHFALYPIKLLMRPIKTCLPKNGIVLDPFMGGATTAIAQRKYCPSGSFIGIEVNPEYIKIALKRIKEESPEQLGI